MKYLVLDTPKKSYKIEQKEYFASDFCYIENL
jgi:hypothetical protein